MKCLQHRHIYISSSLVSSQNLISSLLHILHFLGIVSNFFSFISNILFSEFFIILFSLIIFDLIFKNTSKFDFKNHYYNTYLNKKSKRFLLPETRTNRKCLPKELQQDLMDLEFFFYFTFFQLFFYKG